MSTCTNRKKYQKEFVNCEYAFRHKTVFFNPFEMLKDQDFIDYGFIKPYFSITAQRPDEIIITFEKGNLFFLFNKAINLTFITLY